MSGHIHNPVSFLLYVKEPGGANQRLAGNILEKMMHTLFGNSRIVQASFFQGAEHLRNSGKLPLENGGDFIPFCHDVIQQQSLFSGGSKRFLQQMEILRINGHGIRSEEHTSELQSLIIKSYAIFCCKKKNTQ